MSIIGIDLGTTNSACCIWKDGESVSIPNALGDILTPSVVSLDEENNVIVGKAAKERLITHPQRTEATFKRYMGTAQTLQLGDSEFSPIELSSFVLKSLKSDAESFLNEEVTEAVISVPAYFNDTQRKATKDAAEIAGLKAERLINEPTAAALAYGLHDRPDDARYMILDLGGGTFDVTILEYFEGVMEVHSSAGDNQLGGEDFSELLYQNCLKKNTINEHNLSPQDISNIHHHVEVLKQLLSKDESTSVSFSIQDTTYNYHLTNSEFENLSRDLLERLHQPIKRALMDAKLTTSDLDEVVLVGGATRMSIVKRLFSKVLRRIPSCTIDPMCVVSNGAGVQAGMKANDQALDEIVLTDVSPYTLGTNIYNENNSENAYFSPIIERNSILPCSREETYYNIHDDQDQSLIKIYQGESRFCRNNVYIGEMSVHYPPAKRYECKMIVRFSYDMNGLLAVDVEIANTGKKYSALFEQSPGSLTPEKKQAALERLAQFKFHPRDSQENKALMARLERLYEQSLSDKRHYIASLIEAFEGALESQIPTRIEEMKALIEDRLSYISDSDWLS